jgi:hypothetical protein
MTGQRNLRFMVGGEGMAMTQSVRFGGKKVPDRTCALKQRVAAAWSGLVPWVS